MSCPCDKRIHPPIRVIQAGLERIPRQIAGFPDFRRAMLGALPSKPGLTNWRARGGDDLGIMLLEMWAYVCDVLGFYDETIAHECYLRTARLRPSLRKLVGLLGYLPRPAVASNAHLAAFAEGRQPLKLPAGTAFRSSALDGSPPQVFELDEDTIVHPFTNQWTVKPPKKKIPFNHIDRLLLEPQGLNLRADDLLLIQIAVPPYTQNILARIHKVTPVKGEDELRYYNVFFDSEVDLPANVSQEAVTLLKPTQIAGAKIFTDEDSETDKASIPDFSEKRIGVTALQEGLGISVQEVLGHIDDNEPGNSSWSYAQSVFQQDMLLDRMFKAPRPSDKAESDINIVTLDGTYREIRPGDTVIVSGANGIMDFSVIGRKEVFHKIAAPFKEGDPPTLSLFTELTLDKSFSSLGVPLILHYGFVEAGRIAFENESTLTPMHSLSLLGSVEKPSDGKSPTLFQLEDKNKEGLEAGGNLRFTEKTLTLNPDTKWEKELLLPVQVYGNIVKTTRGETVAGDILGSGDASIPNQSFKLKKKLLTYLSAPTAENDSGVASTLKIYVDGIRWTEVPTFFRVEENAPVYIVRQDDDGNSTVTFGDGRRGSRLPTGRGNVIANYRYGAGAASPPAGSITQLAKPIKGIKSVCQCVPAYGGDNAETSEGLRTYAPRSALILGRAVSIEDMEAIALGFPGVRDASAQWDWHETKQAPVVQIWYVGKSEIEASLEKRLKSVSDPTTSIDVLQAQGLRVELSLSIEIDPRHLPSVVLSEVRATLMNRDTGLLSPERIGIGRPLYRSRIFEAVLSVPGTISVTGIFWNGNPFEAFAMYPGKGNYFDLENGELVISRKEEISGRKTPRRLRTLLR